jgi:hypothetical protein
MKNRIQISGKEITPIKEMAQSLLQLRHFFGFMLPAYPARSFNYSFSDP